ncbi:MAG: endolytic transglycosylase MltG [Saprospiraceae bacterium]|nr:endolytic transglycosylase MltG [Saprospiraceae bacterium]
MRISRNLKLSILAIFIALVGSGLFLRKWLWMDNVKPESGDTELLIPTGSKYEDVVRILKEKDILKSYASFELVAKVLKYKGKDTPSGRYIVKPNMSSFALVRMLRAGFQTPVNLTFNNVRTINELAGKIGKYIEPDSQDLLNVLLDSAYLKDMGFNKFNILSMFIPNTYEFFWNTNPDKFFRRMKSEHEKFWQSSDRIAKAKKLGLNQDEIYTLASIVEKETLVSSEKSTISSVYLNRLRSGQRLQADPTVVFASGDFSLKRIYEKHTQIKSPYNTYRNTGLPPGPICMPDLSTVDAVLNTKDTDYMFFCATGDGSGSHRFAVTFRQHVENANRYRELLNKQDIK